MQIIYLLCAENRIPIAIAILFLFTIILFVVSAKKHPHHFFKEQYERINNTLKKKQGAFFDYSSIQNKLNKNGVAFHFKFFKTPTSYLVLKFLLAFAGLFIGSFAHIGIGVIIAILFFKLPDIYLQQCNKKDNEAMMEDLQTLYNSLQTQIKAGIYPTDAMTETAEAITNKRLYCALVELKGDLLTNLSFKDAVRRMEEKFENKYITSLVLALTQAVETGPVLELLNDLADQIRVMRDAELISKKEKLDRLISFCELGLLFTGILFIVTVFFSEIGTMANSF